MFNAAITPSDRTTVGLPLVISFRCLSPIGFWGTILSVSFAGRPFTARHRFTSSLPRFINRVGDDYVDASSSRPKVHASNGWGKTYFTRGNDNKGAIKVSIENDFGRVCYLLFFAINPIGLAQFKLSQPSGPQNSRL